MKLSLTLLLTILSGSLAYAQAEPQAGQSEVNVGNMELEGPQGRKLVPILALSQTSLQARDRANVTSKGSYEVAAGALYEIPAGKGKLRTGIVYMPIKGHLTETNGQESIVSVNQVAIPAEFHYQIAREHVDGLYLKGSGAIAFKTSSKIEGSTAVVAADNSVDGAADLILGLGIGKNVILNSKMDLGFEAQVLKGQLGYKIQDQTLDQSVIQGMMTLNIKL